MKEYIFNLIADYWRAVPFCKIKFLLKYYFLKKIKDAFFKTKKKESRKKILQQAFLTI